MNISKLLTDRETEERNIADKTLKMLCLPSKASDSAELGSRYGLDKVTVDLIVEGVDGSSPFVGTVCGWEFSLLVFPTLKDAEDKGELLSKLPSIHFVNPICILEDVGGGNFFLVLERFKKLVPNSSNVIDMIRDIMDMVVALDLAFIVHANLKLDDLVMVRGCVKSIGTPLPPTVDMDIVGAQVEQVHTIVRTLMLRCRLIEDGTTILWRQETIEAESFLAVLKDTYTLVDMDSLRLHPFLSPDGKNYIYHCSAMATLSSTNSRFNHKKAYLQSHKPRLNYHWKPRLQLAEGAQKTRLEEVLNYENDGNRYNECVFDLQIFIRNFFQHPNNEVTRVLSFNGGDQIYDLCKNLFPGFLTDLHNYMHVTALNGHLSKTEIMLESFLNAQSAIKFKEQFYIDPLLKTCKIIAFFLAKVRKECTGALSKLLGKTRYNILLKIQTIEDLKNDSGWELLDDVESAYRSHLTTLSISVIMAMDFWRKLDAGFNTVTAALSSLKFLSLPRSEHSSVARKLQNLPDFPSVIRILGADAMTHTARQEIGLRSVGQDISSSSDLQQFLDRN